MQERPKQSSLLALGLVTACTLALQVVLTRLFSAVLAYHFSFLAISLSFLGTGGGALLVYVRPQWFARGAVEDQLARWSAAFAGALIAVPFALVRLDFTGIDELTLGFAGHLTAACVLVALPSLASGVLVALAIDRYSRFIGAVYAYDLVGAGLGALVIVPILWLAPAPVLMVALGGVAALASALFADARARGRTVGLGLAALGVGVVALSTFTSLLYLDPHYHMPKGSFKVAERWTPLARVLGYEIPQEDRLALLFYDRVWAPVYRPRGDRLPTWKELATGPASIGYELTGPGRALVIGGGGGRDIYMALSQRQRPVDVIELSEGNRLVVDEDLGYLSGRPYSRDGVNTVIGDGRSVLAARDTRYDQIHIGFTDTLSANAAQGFALTENNLYTTDAFHTYYDHLAPGGVLSISRLLKLVGDEALRVLVLTLATLEERGIEDPRRHVVAILGKDVLGSPTGTVLSRLEPFTPEEIEKIRRLADERAKGVLFAPGLPLENEWKALAEAPSLETFCESYLLDVCPPTDDKPFFFSMQRLSQVGESMSGYIYAIDPFSILILTLGILVLLAGFAFVLPMALVRGAGRPSFASLTYFAAIGLGFMLLEIVLIQRFVLFLGFPTYALSVVLFALLVFSGLGSYLSSRPEDPRRALVIDLAAVTMLIGTAAYGLQPLLRALIELPFAARVVVTAMLLAPAGIGVGMAMPIGLRRFAALHPTGIPYAWGVNGIASVVASVLGMAVAISFGFAIATLVACGCYAFALAHAASGRWTAPGNVPS